MKKKPNYTSVVDVADQFFVTRSTIFKLFRQNKIMNKVMEEIPEVLPLMERFFPVTFIMHLVTCSNNYRKKQKKSQTRFLYLEQR